MKKNKLSASCLSFIFVGLTETVLIWGGGEEGIYVANTNGSETDFRKAKLYISQC